MKRWLLVALLCASCRDELPNAGCPEGQIEVGGLCRLPCVQDTQCLLSEVCLDGACVPQPDPMRPVIRLFDADPKVVTPGAGTELDYVVLFAESVEIVADGDRTVLAPTAELAGTVSLPSIDETVTLRLTAKRSNGTSATSDLTIQVIDGSFPVINWFTADPNAVMQGGTTELSWSVSNANQVRISGGPDPFVDLPLVGTIPTTIFETTQFELEAENEMGKKSTARVLVQIVQNSPPEIVDFRAISETLPFAVPAVVFWATDRAGEVRLLDQNDRPILVSETLFEAAVGGWMFWSPVGRHEFTLIAENTAGTAAGSVAITREEQPGVAMLQVLEARPLLAEAGVEMQISWQASPQDAQVQLLVDGVPAAMFTSGTYAEVLLDSTTPRELLLIASVPGGPVTHEKHIVYGRAMDLPSSRTNPQVLDRQAVFGTISFEAGNPGDWYSVFTPLGGGLDAVFLSCVGEMYADIVDPATNQILASGQTDANGNCPIVSTAGIGGNLLIRVYTMSVSTKGQYVMVPRIRDPICGDSMIGSFEECDDGNRRPIDGCDPFCRMEPAFQYDVVAEGGRVPPPPPQDAIEIRSWRARTFEPATDEGIVVVPLPFGFPFFGRRYYGVVVHTNGFINLLPDFADAQFDPYAPLAGGTPNGVISLYGADLVATEGSKLIAWFDEATSELAIEMRGFEPKQSRGASVTGRITLSADGRIRLDFLAPEASGTFQVGIEAPQGHPIYSAEGCELGCGSPTLRDLSSVVFTPKAAP